MTRLRVFLGTFFAFVALVGVFVRAQTSDEKKKKAREEMRAVASPSPSETPKPSATPKPAKRKSKSKKKATPTPTPKPKAKAKKTPTSDDDEEESPTPKPKTTKSPHKKSGDEEEDVTPKPKAKASATTEKKKNSEAEKSPTPKEKRTEKAESAKTPSPAATTPNPERTPVEASPVPRPAQRPSPRPPQPQTSLPSDITVEKSGLEQEQGYEPPPPPPPVKKSWWPFSRQPANYRYLTAANIDAIRRAPVQRNRWKFIIVHNSGTRQGSARVFDYYHRHVRRMKNGLAYQFVIGNGTSTRNGQIEIGERWIKQMRGGHVHSDYMNNIGLGICLVGDFNRDQPTRAQLEACEELIRYLQERCGKSDGRSL
ncbi:MAG TPA: N-acetylmuramoyl-L-alanine amidase, partial [Chthoniobacterales bacterium]|nr:N-acetylmuramoyl-L-alanine amidase [Chthoniobacterales bacterium]